MPLQLRDDETLTDEPTALDVRKPRPPFDALKLIEETDEQTLILALVATNPSLDDLLPDDPKLREDLHAIRARIAQRELVLNTDAGEIKNVVNQHIHIHLWDEHTQERLKSLGRSVIGFVVMAKDKIIEAKVKLIDEDDRATISPAESLQAFKDSFYGMVGFMRGKGAEKPLFGWDDKSVVEPSQFADDMASFCANEDDERAVVRLISGAIGEPLNAQLAEVKEMPPSAPESPAKPKKAFQLRTSPDGPDM